MLINFVDATNDDNHYTKPTPTTLHHRRGVHKKKLENNIKQKIYTIASISYKLD